MAHSDIDQLLAEPCFRELWFNSPDNLFILRVEPDDFVLCGVNPAHDRVVKLPVTDARNVPLRQLIAPGFYQRVSDNYRRCVRSAHPLRYEESYVNEEGVYTYWDTMLLPVRDAHGVVGHIFGVCRNITAQKEAEQCLEVARQSAIHASQVKSAFLANMSHELRTPLNGIEGAATLLLETRDPVEQQALARLIKSSVEALSRLTNDTLDYARLNAGAVELELQAFSLMDVLQDVVREHRLAAVEKNLFLLLSAPGMSLSPVRGDPARLGQVLGILCANAVKFTDCGGVTISASAQEDASGMTQCTIRVSDTGIGIAEHDIDSLFQPFAQLDSSSTRRYQGVGLSLAICGQLVSLMGGSIVVNSSPGQGSCFEVRLPLQPAASLGAARVEGASVPRTLSGTVLVAEDNPTNSMVLEKILRNAGLTVLTVGDGDQVINAFLDNQIDLILMDWHMPNRDGLEATRAIRAMSPEGARVPVIGLTANVLPEQQEICLRAGMNEVLTKPVGRDLLLSRLGAWLKVLEYRAASVDECVQEARLG